MLLRFRKHTHTHTHTYIYIYVLTRILWSSINVIDQNVNTADNTTVNTW
jgi:hypothetical protein